MLRSTRGSPINADNTVIVYGEKLELGQGTTTGLRQIAAEELGHRLEPDRLRARRHGRHPEPGRHRRQHASERGPQIRAAAAYARSRRCSAWRRRARRSGCEPDGRARASSPAAARRSPTASSSAASCSTSNMPATTLYRRPVLRRSRPSAYTLVGTRVPRIDIPAKVTGHVHVHPERPRAGHAPRARRPSARPGRVRGRRADRLGRRELDRAHPDVQVVQEGDFLGVVAPKEYDAIQAAAQLKVKWADAPILPGREPVRDAMRSTAPATRDADLEASNTGNVDSGASRPRRRRVSATYTWPTTRCTARSGPTCAVADVDAERRARICARTQDLYEHSGRSLARRCSGCPSPGPGQYYDACAATSATTASHRHAQGGGDHVASSPARRCASSSCAGTSTAGTTTARRPLMRRREAAVDGNGNVVGLRLHLRTTRRHRVPMTSAQLIGIPPDTVGPAKRRRDHTSAGMYNDPEPTRDRQVAACLTAGT